jgi:hypothetical protein
MNNKYYFRGRVRNMSKNKIKRTTRDNFYRPKKFITPDGVLSVRCFKKFINNFIDPYDWGNNKRHFYYHNRKFKYASTELLNSSFITPRTNKRGTSVWYNSSKYKLSEVEVSTHLHTHNKQEYVYYVNSQFSYCPLICLDIDPLDITSDADLQEVVSLLLQLHPDSYYEYSTNGRGIHFYILLDLSDYEINSEYFNNIFLSYSYLLRVYINTLYSVDFDAVKATYSNYAYSEEHQRYLLDKCGTLCKLPRPITPDDYRRLYAIPFTPLSAIDTNAKWLCEQIDALVDYHYAGPCSSLALILPNYDYLLEWLEDNKNNASHRHVIFNLSYNPTSPTTVTYVLGANPNYQSKNKDYEMTNSWEREMNYVFDFFCQYYKEYQEIPSLIECKDNYKKNTGYSKTSSKRENRFKEIYEWMVNYFDPEKLKKKRKPGIYVKHDYVEDIKKQYTKQQLRNLQIEINPKYKKVITFEDISVAAGFYFVSLTRLLPQKKFSKSEFTIAQNNMITWFKDLYERHETSRRCDDGSKVRILREILIDMEWLECIDETYYCGKRSRRHILTEKFPRYSEFEELAGKENIEKWKNNTSAQENKKVG